MKSIETTKVLFRLAHGEVLALFPDLAGTNQPHTCSCYAHVGQHSSAGLAGVMRASRPATPEQYADLAAELKRIGYTLKIGKKTSRRDYLCREEQCH